MPKTLLIDLDGVLSTYNGDYDEFVISPPEDGAREFLEVLARTYKVIIFTIRNKNLTQNWLKEYELESFISGITNIKLPEASIIIDDRALKFNGSYTETLNEIKSFKPFWKKM